MITDLSSRRETFSPPERSLQNRTSGCDGSHEPSGNSYGFLFANVHYGG